jgi:hypothetical protein
MGGEGSGARDGRDQVVRQSGSAAVRYYAQGQRYAFYLTRNRIFPGLRIPDSRIPD